MERSERGTGSAAALQGEGLRSEALHAGSAAAIGIASAAPAYSFAATAGLTAAIAGVHAPAILVVAFVPMLCTALAYHVLNRVDPDCGATFPWVTRSFGPYVGWLGGWSVMVSNVVVTPSLAYVAAVYAFKLVGAEPPGVGAKLLIGCAVILTMTVVCWRGIELSARTQQLLLAAELLALAGFSAWALVAVATKHPEGSVAPSWSWLDPLALSASEVSPGVLAAIFMYWGWDTALNVNEETRGGRTAAGIAAIAATITLVGTYVLAAFAATALRGPAFLSEHPDDVLTALAPGPWSGVVVLAVLASTLAATQTNILPTARTMLSMARQGALPAVFARIHPRYRTPTWSTWAMGIVSIAWFAALVAIDPGVGILWDSISGLGFAIAFYSALTALAAPVLFRRVLLTSARAFVLGGLVPLLGAAGLAYVFALAAIQHWDPAASGSGAWLRFSGFRGVAPAFAIGIGMLVLGIPALGLCRVLRPEFFRNRRAQAAESFTELLDSEPRNRHGQDFHQLS